MLKSSNRAANYKTIERLKINRIKPSESALVINFNHPQDFNAQSQINFLTHKRNNAGLTLPMCVFSESSGSLTNEDGIVQKCEKAVHKNIPIPSVIEYLEKVKV